MKPFLTFAEVNNLGYYFAPNTASIPLLNPASPNRDDLIGLNGEQRVARNQLAYDLLAEATSGAIFFETIEASRTVLEAWHAIVSSISPSSETAVGLMRRQLDNVVNYDGEEPRLFILRVDKLHNELRFVDEGRSD
ncbi:unnamed protein product, partial [Hapterophycus canaliculatus]